MRRLALAANQAAVAAAHQHGVVAVASAAAHGVTADLPPVSSRLLQSLGSSGTGGGSGGGLHVSSAAAWAWRQSSSWCRSISPCADPKAAWRTCSKGSGSAAGAAAHSMAAGQAGLHRRAGGLAAGASPLLSLRCVHSPRMLVLDACRVGC